MIIENKLLSIPIPKSMFLSIVNFENKTPANMKTSEIFWQMVEQGTALRKLHLLESATVSKNLPIFHGTGNNIVDKKIKFEDEKVYINETQYFTINNFDFSNGSYSRISTTWQS